MLPSKFLAISIFYIISLTQEFVVQGDNCSNLDSCRISNTSTFRTCSCDDDCYKYGTCCQDAKNVVLMSKDMQEFECYDDRVVTPVLAKKTCSPHGSKVNEDIVCMETGNDRVDVMNSRLVTSTRTKITYWNKQCGICNNENIADLTPWTVQAVCPKKHKSKSLHSNLIKRNLMFNWEMEEWGLNIDGEFVNCTIVQYQPVDTVGKLKYCAPDLINFCPPGHGDEEMIKYCSLYHGERKHKHAKVYFRNVHCALCNGVSRYDLDCIGRNYSPIGRNVFPNTVKVVFRTDEWNALMGGVHRYKCTKDFEYDPFIGKCRRDNTEHSIENVSYKTTSSMAYLLTLFISFFIFNKLLV